MRHVEDYVTGDRVLVTMPAEVIFDFGGTGQDYCDEGIILRVDGQDFTLTNTFVRKSTENDQFKLVNLGPKYDQFKPGDVVYPKTSRDDLFALGVDGFMALSTGEFHRYGENFYNTLENFNSRSFVKAEL